jgi:ribose/xylose/arabinose/galactoside ABC-type transport system permease subunit
MAANQISLTDDQRKDNLNRYDSLADGIITISTGLGGFNSLGLWAGQVVVTQPLNAFIYTLPILAFAIAIMYALWGKFEQWNMDSESYSKLFATKQKRIRYAFISLMAGLFLLFLALLVYTLRVILKGG